MKKIIKCPFDTPLDRSGTAALKFEARRRLFGSTDVQPMWVADMDFASPAAVTAALQLRAAHPVYGYTEDDGSAVTALAHWWQHRHGWSVSVGDILLAPGMVPCLYAAVAAFTQEGEGVLVQTPVYPPFFSAVRDQGRIIVDNPLIRTQAGYSIDWEQFEAGVRQSRLFLLCSPHNPVGRVWTPEELNKMLELCQRYDVWIFADEIHADLLLGDSRHYSIAAWDGSRVITGVAPSKTFNIPGMGLSAVLIPDSELKRRWQQYWRRCPVGVSNPFSLKAFQVAYAQGGEWLDSLLRYLTDTRNAALAYIHQHLPRLNVAVPQATYLLWIDFSPYNWTDRELEQRLVEVGLGLSAGSAFGRNGHGHMRLNFAAPRSEVLRALAQLRRL